MFMSNTATDGRDDGGDSPGRGIARTRRSASHRLALSDPGRGQHRRARHSGRHAPERDRPGVVSRTRGSGSTSSPGWRSPYPSSFVILGAAWLLLVRRYPADADAIDVSIGGEFDRSRPALILYATFAVTVLLWLTEPIHGVPATIVGFVPVVTLLATGVMDSDDLRHVNWHVLWLVGGGIRARGGRCCIGTRRLARRPGQLVGSAPSRADRWPRSVRTRHEHRDLQLGHGPTC